MLNINNSLIKQIIYAMEDQREPSFLDTQTMTIVHGSKKTESDKDQERYWSLPPWKSSDGFQLMKGYIIQLKNPVYRERLNAILESGQGVFKKFKTLIKETPLLEKGWIDYKNSQMKERILQWFSVYLDATTLQKLEEPETEIEELLLTDVTLSDQWQPFLKKLKIWDREALKEINPLDNSNEEIFKERFRLSGTLGDQEDDKIYLAMINGEEPAGLLWLKPWPIRGNKEESYWIQQLYVSPEFRGMGISRLLLRHGLKGKLYGSLPPSAAFLKKRMEQEGYSDFLTILMS